jgi:hypothetical protein
MNVILEMDMFIETKSASKVEEEVTIQEIIIMEEILEIITITIKEELVQEIIITIKEENVKILALNVTLEIVVCAPSANILDFCIKGNA